MSGVALECKARIPRCSLDFQEDAVLLLHLLSPRSEVRSQSKEIFLFNCILTVRVACNLFEQVFSLSSDLRDLCDNDTLACAFLPLFQRRTRAGSSRVKFLVEHFPDRSCGLAPVHNEGVNQFELTIARWSIGFYDDGDPVVIKTEILGMAIQSLLNPLVDPSSPAEKTSNVLLYI